MHDPDLITQTSIQRLSELIRTPSFSREEGATADLMAGFLAEMGFSPERKGNNVWAFCPDPDPEKPWILLNSHHDTVKPVSSWTRDPFSPDIEDGTLFGLGSNDAGGPLISLLAVFGMLCEKEQPYNLAFLASAEEEISGKGGVPLVIGELPDFSLGVVGEPTCMEMAVAERGLLVLDCTAHGKSGHAARGEGENAIYKAMQDIQWMETHQFNRNSELLGPVHMTVTQIEAGYQHNVVPDSCTFVVDVRPNDQYTNEELLEIIREHTQCEIIPRNMLRKASVIPEDHPVVKRAVEMEMKRFGSQTMSDQVHMTFPTVKIGPGDTHRSHTADEFIKVDEIREGVEIYFRLLDGLGI